MKIVRELRKAVFEFVKTAGWLGCIAMLLCVTISTYVGYKTARVQSFNNDSVITNLMVANPSTINHAIFLEDHSFMMKWPPLILGAYLLSPFQTYLLSTIMFYVVTVIGFYVTIYVITKKNTKLTIVLSMMITSTLSLVPVQAGDHLLPANMAMISTRNAEILLFLWYLIALAQWATGRRRGYAVLAGALLFIIGISDTLFLYIALLSGGIVSTGTIIKTKRFAILLPIHMFWWMALVITVTVVMVKLLLSAVGLMSFYKMGITGATRDSLFAYVEAFFGTVQASMESFGAGVFNMQLDGKLLLSGLAAALFAYGSYRLVRLVGKFTHSIERKPRELFVYILAVATLANVAIYAMFAPEPLRDIRFLCLVPIGIVVSIAYAWSERTDIQKLIEKHYIVIILLLLGVIISSVAVFRDNATRVYMVNQAKYGTNIDVFAEVLQREHIPVALTRFYTVGPVALRSPHTLVVPLAEAGRCVYKESTYLTVKDWYIPQSNIRSAIMLVADYPVAGSGYNNGCTEQFYVNKLGKPTKIVGVAGELSARIFVYDYDIRTKLDRVSPNATTEK